MSEVQLIKKPCPYPRCGSENTTVMHSESLHADHPERPIRYHVQCKECGTRGPMEHDEFFAIQGWNNIPRIEMLDKVFDALMRLSKNDFGQDEEMNRKTNHELKPLAKS